MSNNQTELADLLEPQRKFAARAKPETLTRGADAADDYVACGLASIGRRPQMMIAFKKCDGQVEVFPYSMLTRIRSTNPDRRFTLVFPGLKISIAGEKLERLFHYVCEHRARELVEADRAVGFVEQGECLISAIKFNPD